MATMVMISSLHLASATIKHRESEKSETTGLQLGFGHSTRPIPTPRGPLMSREIFTLGVKTRASNQRMSGAFWTMLAPWGTSSKIKGSWGGNIKTEKNVSKPLAIETGSVKVGYFQTSHLFQPIILQCHLTGPKPHRQVTWTSPPLLRPRLSHLSTQVC